jgi:hypothetical protein
LLVGSNAAVNLSQAAADDQAMLLRVNRRFANGLMIDVNYTWSKNIDKTDTVEDNQGFNAGGGARGASHYLSDFDQNRRIGYSDVWGWYDGNTRVTLPSGRVMTPLARTHLNYNPDAFAGQIITLPDGRNIVDQYWYGSAAITFDEIAPTIASTST